MQEGLTVNLVLSGATLVTVVSVAVRVWLSTRPQKIEQPLEIKDAEHHHYNSRLCEQRHQSLAGQITDIYAKLNSAREGLAEIRGSLASLKTQVSSIDGKMDKLLEKH